MPIVSERFQLSTRNTMVYETPYDPSVRQHIEEEDDSEDENNDSAEMIRVRFLISLCYSTLACGTTVVLA